MSGVNDGERELVIRTEKDLDKIRVAVHDSGKGFSAESLELGF
jgi:signal transduction histidine kinase